MLTRIHTQAIVKLMQTAKLHVDYPKIKLQQRDFVIQLSVAGERAKYPNSINITDGKPYPNSKWFGRIYTNGNVKYSTSIPNGYIKTIKTAFEQFAENPTAYAKLYSNVTGNCMFCSRELTDPQSVAVGYGPVCAGNFGLPHGEFTKQLAEDIAQIEMDMSNITMVVFDELQNEKPTTIEDKVALLELEVEQLKIVVHDMQIRGK